MRNPDGDTSISALHYISDPYCPLWSLTYHTYLCFRDEYQGITNGIRDRVKGTSAGTVDGNTIGACALLVRFVWV
jgi:hypothetical protein